MVIFQWLKSWYTSLGPHLQFLQRFAVVKTTWCWSIFGGPGGRLKWFDLLKKSSCFDGFLLVWYFKLKKQTWEISGPWWHSENLEARMLIGLIQVCQVCLVKMSTKAMRKKSFRNWPKGFHVWKNNYQQFYTSSQPKIQLPKFKKAKKKKKLEFVGNLNLPSKISAWPPAWIKDLARASIRFLVSSRTFALSSQRGAGWGSVKHRGTLGFAGDSLLEAVRNIEKCWLHTVFAVVVRPLFCPSYKRVARIEKVESNRIWWYTQVVRNSSKEV